MRASYRSPHWNLNRIAAFAGAGLDNGAFVAKAGGGEAKVASELGEILAADVAQLHALEIAPDALVRVEVWSVARERLQADTSGATLSQEVLDRLATMDRGPIPDDQELAGDVAEQMGRSEGAVKQLQFRAFETLRARLGDAHV